MPAALLASQHNQADSGLPQVKIEPDDDQLSPYRTYDWPTPCGSVLLGILPFMLFGSAYLIQAAYELGWLPVGSSGLVRVATLIVYGLVSLGLIPAWLLDFPRWSLAYLGMGLYFGYDFSHAQIYGVRYGWQGWLPLACGLVVGLLFSQSFRPLLLLFWSTWRDWTRLSYLIYAYLLPVMTIVFFDSDWGQREFYGLIFDTLLLAAGAAAFMRSQTTWKKILSLQAVILIMLVRGILMAGWMGGLERLTSFSLQGWITFVLFWGGLMFAPGLLAVLRRVLGVDKLVEEG